MDSQLRRQLTARANKLKPTLVVGRAGVSEGVTAQLNQLLEKTELVKIRLDVDHSSEATELATELARAVGAELVKRIGKTAVLFRELSDDKGETQG